MNTTLQKFNRVRLVTLLTFIVVMSIWLATLSRYDASTFVIIIGPLITTVFAIAILLATQEPLGKALINSDGHTQVLGKMLKSLAKSPGESREFEGFVFAHFVPFARKHPDELAALFAGVPYQVTYRLIDYVEMLTKAEDQAFRAQPEPQNAETYKKILADIEELEGLLSALRDIAGADLRTEEEKQIGFAPVMN